MPRTLNIIRTLERIHAARERLEQVDEVRRQELKMAIDAATSVVVIYLKMGPEPSIKDKHWAGIKKLDTALERC